MQSDNIFRVIKPGALTTVQDMGRAGFQRFGVPLSGAMDMFAFQIGNILVGNPRNYASLEVTLTGPKLEAMRPVTIAITGANLEPKINGAVKPMWATNRMNRGDILEFDKHQSGVRAYIAIAGGMDAKSHFGSKSVDMNSGFGSALEIDTVLKGYPSKVKAGIGLQKQYIPKYEKRAEVAVIEGPHTDSFTIEQRKKFFNSTFEVDANSNRMGYRLLSEKITPKNPDIISDAVPFGGIQIPGNGQPIILMADRQTTGGYPRIGTVISADLPKVAQLPAKGEIKFYPVSIEEAQKRLIKMENFLTGLEVFRNYF